MEKKQKSYKIVGGGVLLIFILYSIVYYLENYYMIDDKEFI
jgi:hypothetical protein